jgi:hypothetical protein
MPIASMGIYDSAAQIAVYVLVPWQLHAHRRPDRRSRAGLTAAYRVPLLVPQTAALRRSWCQPDCCAGRLNGVAIVDFR